MKSSIPDRWCISSTGLTVYPDECGSMIITALHDVMAGKTGDRPIG
jgi:hypothetical protein